MTRHGLTHVLDQARHIVRDLERLTSKRPLDQALLDELGQDELSTNQITLRVRRRRQDVVAMLRQMEKSGDIRRDGRVWRLTR